MKPACFVFAAWFAALIQFSAAADSIDSIKQEIAGMKAEGVAWRKVEWRTCLIDGLRESREQNKPVILWIFIDRPIDDKRC